MSTRVDTTLYNALSDNLISSKILYSRYQTIAEPGKGLDIESESTKLIEPDWIYNLGEAVLAINSVTLSTIETGIVVITERNLYCFHETHLTLKFSKRLAYNAICIETYIIGKISLHTVILCIK